MGYKFTLLLSLVLLCGFAAGAQTIYVTGQISTIDAKGAIQPVMGATVMVASPSDTAYVATIRDGRYIARVKQSKSVFIQATYTGMKTYTTQFTVTDSRVKHDIIMEESTTQIQQINVAGKVPVMTMSGDTIVYNAAATSTFEDDYAEEILAQLPGVEVEDNSITIQGVNVERVYVDGKLLFGKALMTALQNLRASDVTQMKVYDELSEEAILTGQIHDEKRRVIDIITKSKPRQIINAITEVRGGFDTEQKVDGTYQERYLAGGMFNMFGSKGSVMAVLSTGNTGSNMAQSFSRGGRGESIRSVAAFSGSSNAYSRNNLASITLNKRWQNRIPESDTLVYQYRNRFEARGSISYSYNDNYTRNWTVTERNYSTKSQRQTDYSNDTTRSVAESYQHNLRLSVDNAYRGYDLSGEASFSNNDNNNFSGGYTLYKQTRPDVPANEDRSHLLTLSKEKSYSLSQSGSWRPWRKGPAINASFTYTNDDRTSEQADTLATTTSPVWLENLRPGYSRQFNTGTGGGFRIINTETQGLYFNASYRFSYNHSISEKVAIDKFTEEIDSTRSSSYLTDNNTHTLSGSLRYSLRDKFTVSVSARGNSTGINRNEWLPTDYEYDHRFNSINPSASVSFGPRTGPRMSVNYSANTSSPSVTQLRTNLTYTNPRNMSTGNPDLKQSTTQNFSFSAFRTNELTGSTLNFNLSYATTANAIVSRTKYYTDATYLPRWDITTPTNAQLTSYENINGEMSASGDLRYSFRSDALKSNADFSLRMSYGENPYFINDTLNTRKTSNPSLSINTRTDIASKLSISLRASGSYSYSQNVTEIKNSNSVQDNKSARLTTAATLAYRPVSWFFASSTYSYSKSYSIANTNSGKNQETQRLNATVGFRFLKSNAECSFSAVDILNTTKDYTFSTNENYTQSQWRLTQGRCLMLNLSYRFNSSRGEGSSRSGERPSYIPGSGGPGGPGGIPSGSSSDGSRGGFIPGGGMPIGGFGGR